jgi:hypothetical protein
LYAANNVGRLAKNYGGLELPFSSGNLRAVFALGLCGPSAANHSLLKSKTL